jgi:hypothetical protein
MTDARLPDRWLSDRRFHRLKDNEYRSFIQSLIWSVSNRTNGVIEPEDLWSIPCFDPDAVKAFVDRKLWCPRKRGIGWKIADFQATQTSREELDRQDRARAKNRDRQARHRANVTRDITRDVTGDVTGDCLGQDRTGQDRLLCNETNNVNSGESQNFDDERPLPEEPLTDADGFPLDDDFDRVPF